MAERYEKVKGRRREIFFNNLLGGIAWGVGATIGLALFLALLGLLGKYIDFVPFVGNFVSQIIDFVLNKNPNLISFNLPFIWSQYFYA